MRKIIILTAMVTIPVCAGALAQTADESVVILPLEAQTCNLPVAPGLIPDDFSYEDLAKAKGNVVSFQAGMKKYRDCLDASGKVAMLTDGNKLAINNAHNYSVEMEERIAEQFNVAVRAYKARKAE